MSRKSHITYTCERCDANVDLEEGKSPKGWGVVMMIGDSGYVAGGSSRNADMCKACTDGFGSWWQGGRR